ncbi:hypothetical protein GOODEAATRI_032196 [Goodea atripinnis]|uniref:Uncharacterized protein n=1 Tax=Goodea atripinnis TaxID=208336 RepID=A0ABV0P9F0_9TELE
MFARIREMFCDSTAFPHNCSGSPTVKKQTLVLVLNIFTHDWLVCAPCSKGKPCKLRMPCMMDIVLTGIKSTLLFYMLSTENQHHMPEKRLDKPYAGSVPEMDLTGGCEGSQCPLHSCYQCLNKMN